MALYFIGIALIFGLGYAIFDHQRLKRISVERGDPNICEYARSFDYRQVDTKIMREVWNEVQLCLGNFEGKPFPIKADDLFEDTYKMDSDDLDEVYWAVADRLGIDTESPESNPYFDQVTSVKNLVMFLQNQPKVANV
ncbi:hypothetical protein [Shewanella decolorationis]|uniref:hypothetical protein n=1 Tax=Shewanella decolorationis TaxID=256839 RepID=UPI001057069D|nr:hypothetical protein [Shewanella decolorationis]